MMSPNTPNPRSGVRRLLLGALCWVAFFVFSLQPALSQTTPSPELPENPLSGRKVFQAKSCSQCHHLVGSGPGIAPSLGAETFQGSFLELGASLWNHAPAMSGSFARSDLEWPQLDPEEARQLIAFLYFIDYLGRPGAAGAGKQVFEREGCPTCHTLGSGRSIGPDLAEVRKYGSPLSVAQEIWNHGPSMFESMQGLGMSAPQFGEGDLADLSAYIRQKAEDIPKEISFLTPGNPRQGRTVFSQKGCSQCHGRDARGGAGGPDLSRYNLHQPAETIVGMMWNHALAMNEAMRASGIRWPTFQGTELADLVAYLYFLSFDDLSGDAGRGSNVFAQRSCSECHSRPETASGQTAAPDLFESADARSTSSLVAAMWNHAPLMKQAILGKGRPWPELTGQDLQDLRAFLSSTKLPD